MTGTVLIAGRNDASRRDLLSLLSHRHLNIHAVCDEMDFLLELIERDYDVAIYDLSDSIVDELKLVKVVRRIRPKVPLVVMSDNPARELCGQILQEGVSYLGVKPVNPEAVRTTLAQLLKQNEGGGR